ncbi:MAG: hypothetical protein V5A55_03855 [Halovenus sp.]
MERLRSLWSTDTAVLLKRKAREFGYGIAITASFGVLFVLSYFALETVVLRAQPLVGIEQGISVGWLLSIFMLSLCVTILVNMGFSKWVRRRT